MAEKKAKEVQEAVVITEQSEETKKALVVKLDSIDTLDEMLEYVTVLTSSKMLPYNTPEKAIVAYQFGKELGLGIVTAMSNIYVISGRPSLSIHAMGALLKKGGIEKRTIEDYAPYTVKYKDADGNDVEATTRRTTIEFMRMWNGEVIREEVSYTWEDAKKAGYTDKDNWKKMPKIMLWSRCFAIGARRVSPDTLLGMYEASEAADIENVTIDLDSDGNPIRDGKIVE
jgi:hypothetical protein